MAKDAVLFVFPGVSGVVTQPTCRASKQSPELPDAITQWESQNQVVWDISLPVSFLGQTERKQNPEHLRKGDPKHGR